jgi:2-aminoadipate transaminase
MIEALQKFLPSSVSWYVPEGGYFVWAKVPEVDTAELLPKALAAGVSFVPGKFFFLHQEEGTEFLRLSFSYASEEEIIKGIQLLGEVIALNLPATT